MAEIKIDGKLFQERISQLSNAWKNDIRSKENVFQGASSIVIMMGKVEESGDYHKNHAMHVSLPFVSSCHGFCQSNTCSSGSWATNFPRRSCF